MKNAFSSLLSRTTGRESSDNCICSNNDNNGSKQLKAQIKDRHHEDEIYTTTFFSHDYKLKIKSIIKNTSNIIQPSISEASSTHQEHEQQENESKQTHWKILLLGQSIALSLSCCSASSSTVQVLYGVSIPLFQTGWLYFFLSFHLFFLIPSKDTTNVSDDFRGDWDLHITKLTKLDENQGKCSHWTSHSSEEKHDCKAIPKNGKILMEGKGKKQTYRLPLTTIPLHAPWYSYALLAILDVEANYLSVLSFKYTSLTSASLLASLSVPSVMIFSKFVLNRVFGAQHFFGAAFCLVGASLMVYSDFRTNIYENNTNSTMLENLFADDGKTIRGDILAILSAFLYGLSDTLAELFIRNMDRVEYLGMLGLFGTVLSIVQCPLVEYHELHSIFGDIFLFSSDNEEKSQDGNDSFYMAMVIMIWYVICLLYFYIAASYFMTISDATMLTLSLQTSQMWVILFSIVAQKVVPKPMFFGAVLFVVTGVLIYELGYELERMLVDVEFDCKKDIDIESGDDSKKCCSCSDSDKKETEGKFTLGYTDNCSCNKNGTYYGSLH